MSIIVDHVTKLYGAQKALDDISFSVAEGEIVGFLGPNGAGKSTMMKIITSYLPATSGTVTVCGLSVAEDPIKVKSKIGYLPEHNPLYLDMYVKEFLAFIADIYKLNNTKSRVQEMVELVGLSKEQHKKIGALSKGYRQRVGLASAIIHNPEVLILDEPTTGLDPNQIIEIRNIIKELGKQKTVMMSTHILQEVEAICDRVIILNRGKLVANENRDTINTLVHDIGFILEVEFSTVVLKEQLLSIAAVDRVEAIHDRSFKIISRKDVRDVVFAFAVNNQLSVLTMKQSEGNLEEIFKTLTQ